MQAQERGIHHTFPSSPSLLVLERMVEDIRVMEEEIELVLVEDMVKAMKMLVENMLEYMFT